MRESGSEGVENSLNLSGEREKIKGENKIT